MQTIAANLLKINAVRLNPTEPFHWASGILSPIYCDNRLTISYPQIRREIAVGLAKLINQKFPEATVIAGTATAGIPHATSVADLLNLPLIYVRSQPKDHGRGRQIEGVLPPDAKVVVLDDLISTGGSVLKAVAAVQNEGATVVGVAGIFNYQLPQATANFAAANMPWATLSNYTELLEVAKAQHDLSADQLTALHAWRQDPTAWRPLNK